MRFRNVVLSLLVTSSVASANCGMGTHLGICYENDAEGMNRFFLGVAAGWSLNDIDWGSSVHPANVTLPTMASFAPSKFDSYTMGANFGYKQALNGFVGFRYYIDYYYFSGREYRDSMAVIFVATQPRETNMIIQTHNVNANVDFYFQLRNSLGFYVGLGVGANAFMTSYSLRTPGVTGDVQVNFSNTTDYSIAFSLPVNVGITYQFLGNNILSINGKISTLPIEYDVRFVHVYGGNAVSNGVVKNRFYNVTIGYTREF